jgi:hypothetical protein
MADARVTQDVVEILSLPVASAQITQDVIEVLGTAVTAAVPERVELFIVMPV